MFADSPPRKSNLQRLPKVIQWEGPGCGRFLLKPFLEMKIASECDPCIRDVLFLGGTSKLLFLRVNAR